MEGDKLRRHLIQFFRWQLEQGYIDTEDKMYVPYEVAEKYLDEKDIDYSLSDSTSLVDELPPFKLTPLEWSKAMMKHFSAETVDNPK